MYLEMSKLDESEMSHQQIIETRRAFYGGCGVMFRMMWNDDIYRKSDEELLTIMKDIENQISEFWSNAITRNKSKLN